MLRRIILGRKNELIGIVFLYLLLAALDVSVMASLGLIVKVYQNSPVEVAFLQGGALDLSHAIAISLLVIIIRVVLSVVSNKSILSIVYRIRLDLRKAFVERVLARDFESFIKKSVADYLFVANDLIHMSVQYGLLSILRIISDAIITVVIIVVLFSVIGGLVLYPFIIISIFILLVTPYLRKASRSLGAKSNVHAIASLNLIKSTVVGYRYFKLYGGSKVLKKQISISGGRYNSSKIKEMLISQSSRYVTEIALLIAVFTLLLGLEKQLFVYEFQSEHLVYLLYGMMRLVPILSSLLRSMANLNASMDSMHRVDEFFLDEAHSNKEIFNIELEVDNKSYMKFRRFNYAVNDKVIFDDFNASIEQGKWLAITGQSGSGKSMLIDLMLGFRKGNKGFGVSKEYKELHHSKKIGYLPQDPSLIYDTIIENITENSIGEINLKSEMSYLQEIISICHLTELVAERGGIDGYIGLAGAELSGGQRQRVSLARAIYKGSQLLILDEPTSALDRFTSETILNNMKKSGLFNTVIIVTHDPKIVEYCDTVVHLD